MSNVITPPSKVMVFQYTNYKGEKSLRRAIPKRIRFEGTVWHPEPQWILYAYDIDKKAERGFALQDCVFSR
jgi:predicted DNA-binding transcriptional regulator YafY